MPEPRLLTEIRADLDDLHVPNDDTADQVFRLLNDIAPLCDEVEKLREHKAALVQAIDGKVTTVIDRERDALRAERDEAQAWAELIGQAVVGILGIHEDEVPDQVELLRLAQAEASTRERLRAQILIVHAHVNQRPEYITALRNSTDTGGDYGRWSGHAEARRQLAEALGMTVPYEHGETTQPKAGE
ncbi:hypothetical protein TPA4_63 [Tsukamurella phage TPA4]|uniref:hypothetical protein n=1 Tax=Tsukamurella phage TPA4 TaxID=1647476 RepID=UPI0007B60FD9|nr:hypothetical protein BH784_gp63 [Tsukamurella phage TPA4]AKJ72228.1 hypothetical protein TPA4_63 [Tsukamurella phage TPA4]